jgi:hypothetical protein
VLCWICATRKRASTEKRSESDAVSIYSLRNDQAMDDKHNDECRKNANQEERLYLLALPQSSGALAALDESQLHDVKH